MTEPTHRNIRSFVLRKGRLTTAQRHALDELWPHYGIEQGETVLEFDDHFDRPADVIVEIGFGNGESTWQMALAEPEINFIGIEVHEPGVGHLLMALDEHSIENVRIACEDAVPFLQHRIAAASLAGVRIYFADPWPKKRHHKRRFICEANLIEMLRCLKVGGSIRIATDHAGYFDQVENVINSQNRRLEKVDFLPTAGAERGEWVGTNFEFNNFLVQINL